MPPKAAAKQATKPTSSSGGKSAKKKKWSKGKVKDKANNAVVLDKPLFDKIVKDVPTFKAITIAQLVDRCKVNGSLARRAIKYLENEGSIKKVVHHNGILLYTRTTGGTD